MNSNNRITRRDFLKLGATGISGLALKDILGFSNELSKAGQEKYSEEKLGTTYYVRKDGNDTYGNGSVIAPWLTLSKALTVAGSGDIVKVGDGLYEESTSGLGYWNININKALTKYLTIEAESGSKGNVRVQGLSHAYYNTLLRCGYLRFRHIQFTQRLATNISAFSVNTASNISSVAFDYCSFIITANGSTPSQGFIANMGNGWTASNFTFTGCTFSVLAYITGSHDGCRIGISGTTGVVNNFTFIGCTANGRYGLWVNGATNVLVDGGSYGGYYSAAICIGVDSENNGKTSSVIIHNVEAMTSENSGNAVFIGNGATGCVVDGLVVPACSDIALVLKEHGIGGGTEVKNCELHGGNSCALLCKAAANANIHHNQLIDGKVTKNGTFRMLGGDTGNKSNQVIFTDNYVLALGGMAVEWGDATQDNGGGICDRNVYHLRGAVSLARVRGITASTMAELQAAWNGYDVFGNDLSSTMVVDLFLPVAYI
jgi:hypothetical protein